MFKSVLLLTLAGLSIFTEAGPIKRRGGSKRGLAFPKQHVDSTGQSVAGSSWTHAFSGNSKISWMYDWEAVIDGEAIDVEYVPLLHSNQQWCTEGWFANVAAARQKYQVTSLLSFNEPEQDVAGGGSAMSVADAVSAHQQYIQPLAKEGLRIGSPAVTNGVGENKGVNWLKQFVAQCEGCQINFVVAHYYAWDKAADFKSYLQDFYKTFNKPVWITEFGVTEGDAAAFLTEVLPWLDSQDWIERYAWQMVAPTKDVAFLLTPDGNGLSAAGQVYASA